MYDTTPLFTPLQVKHKTLRNRIVMPPMETNRDLAGPDGRAWYGEHAAGGAGLVIVEATQVGRFGADLTAANLRPLVDAIHAGGALAAIQLFPGVRGQALKPAGMSPEEIRQMVDRYRQAAEVCAGAGFDGVEPHGAHGLPAQPVLFARAQPAHRRLWRRPGGSHAVCPGDR